jgi:hypothetical protein
MTVERQRLELPTRADHLRLHGRARGHVEAVTAMVPTGRSLG